MTWRLRIVHNTGFAYNSPVYSSYNEARLTPKSDARQTLITHRVTTNPNTKNFLYTDYWGTNVTTFDLHAPHTELLVSGNSIVETDDGELPTRILHWENYTDSSFIDQYNEMLSFTHYVPYDPELAQIAEDVTLGCDPVNAVRSICGWIHETLTYVPGSTLVHTNAVESYRERKGVCQDYAHIALSMLRSVKIPARYVNGYLHPQLDAEIDETVIGESHSWIEAFVGEWWGFDPTNNIEIGKRHATVGIGRDYSDVPPLKGIISGGGATDLDVVVEITRLA